MVARLDPILKYFFFRRPFDPSKFKCERRDADFYEAVLIAADEAITVGFSLGLNNYVFGFGDGANVVTERGARRVPALPNIADGKVEGTYPCSGRRRFVFAELLDDARNIRNRGHLFLRR